MIYNFARELIAMFFLIAIVNLLVIPESYKKIITFYMHFFIIVIILNPLVRIMNNEVGSFIDSITFITEEAFEESVQEYQKLLADDVKEFTMSELDEAVRQAADVCLTEVTGIELNDVLTIKMMETSNTAKECMRLELRLRQEDVVFERGGR